MLVGSCRGSSVAPTPTHDFRGTLPLRIKQRKVRERTLSAASQTHPQSLTTRALRRVQSYGLGDNGRKRIESLHTQIITPGEEAYLTS